MSHNLYLKGTRTAIVKNRPHIEFEDTIQFNLWQTPSKVTWKVLEEMKTFSEQVKAYKEWAKSVSQLQEVATYHPDDDYCEGELISVKMIDESEEHFENFDRFVDECNKGGYILEFYTI